MHINASRSIICRYQILILSGKKTQHVVDHAPSIFSRGTGRIRNSSCFGVPAISMAFNMLDICRASSMSVWVAFGLV